MDEQEPIKEEVTKPKMSEKAEYDHTLVRAAIDNGDQKAYAELMDRYRDSLYYMVKKMVGNDDDADDLTIEAFTKAFLRLDQYNPQFAFSTWLFKIATNGCIDFIRKKKMNTVSIDKPMINDEGDHNAMQIPHKGFTPEEDLVRKQNVILIRGIVDKLKPHYKLLVEMRYFQELSIEEISKEMNMPTGTVKAQLFRAREFLANILEKVERRKK